MLKHNALFVGADVGGAKSGIKGLNNKIMQLRKFVIIHLFSKKLNRC